jgi:hypothetical protein
LIAVLREVCSVVFGVGGFYSSCALDVGLIVWLGLELRSVWEVEGLRERVVWWGFRGVFKPMDLIYVLGGFC